MASFGEGDAGKDLIWVIGIIFVIGVIWIFMGGPASFKSGEKSSGFFSAPTNIIPGATNNTTTSGGKKTTTSGKTTSPVPSATPKFTSAQNINPNDSQYKGQVEIRLGQSGESGSSLDQEYVVLTASAQNKAPLNISGWKIDNGKSGKYYDVYGKMVQGKSTQVTIPLGTTLLSGITKNPLDAIKLSPGGRAYVVTGHMPNTSPYKIDASFQVNKCSGYLEALPNYKFTPTLSGSCPAYKIETDNLQLSDSCLKIVDNYGSNCHTPVISQDPTLGEVVDKLVIPADCKRIVLNTFNYSSCFTRHLADPDFYKKDWYVYLNYSGFPLYAKDRVIITLYDSIGKIVDTYAY